jgi:hypothetical protein
VEAILFLLLAAQPAEGLAPDALARARAERCGPAPADERAKLAAERSELELRINDLAMGKKPKRKASGADVARGVAGTAASVLLPFPLGAAVNAAGAAASKGKKRPGQDPAPLLARAQEIDTRLTRLEGC